jgi:Rod binding domain-containing protein
MIGQMSQLSAAPSANPAKAGPDAEARLRDSARQLEVAFLASMLDAAGAGAPRESFGGGIGEDQFSSFLVQSMAEAMVARGGIGLAESLFNAMKVRDNAGA